MRRLFLILTDFRAANRKGTLQTKRKRGMPLRRRMLLLSSPTLVLML